ncbi:MAG: DUF2851 family protein [Bacteroidota bacterium]
MQEDFLYYVWKLQYFDKRDLRTHQGDQLAVLDPGTHNTHAGPDFLHSSILINNLTWHGHVELHVCASSWHQHKHQVDPAYENVVLHVVWDNDRSIRQQDGSILPTLVLQDRVVPQLLQQYQELVHNKTVIPCARQFSQVDSIIKTAMSERAFFQRLTHKNNLVYQLLDNNQGDWEETAYQLLAYNFGFKVNSSALLDLSLRLPLRIINKHVKNLSQLEALLLGQAGLLASTTPVPDDYLATLAKEYAYLAHKYQLKTNELHPIHWKFFRLRPANFPTIRIAQLAQLLHQHPHIFYLLTHTSPVDLYQQLAITQSAYWQQHYRFAKPSKARIPGLGKASIENIMINTIVPLLVAYGESKDEQGYIDQAMALLQRLPAERNAITRHWEELGMPAKSAFDSQAMLELFNNFCSKKKCLVCNIGGALMQRTMLSIPAPPAGQH